MLEAIRHWITMSEQVSSRLPVRIKGLCGLRLVYQPSAAERKFVYNIVVAQTLGQGACYYIGDEVPLDTFISHVGQEYSGQQLANKAVDIALLDSLAQGLERQDWTSVQLTGSAEKKAQDRARLIGNEVKRVAEMRDQSRPVMVCNVGVVQLVIDVLVDFGYSVIASDYEFRELRKVPKLKAAVLGPESTLEAVAEADVAVVTGMTLATDSLGDILTVAASHDTDVVIFAETGSGFADFYVQRGAKVVISEPFPFYIFGGVSEVRILRSDVAR